MEPNTKALTVEAYIASQSETAQLALHEIRSLIRSIIPDAKEMIAWGMPSYKGHHYIVHFAAHKAHLGLYPGAEAIVHFQDRLKDYHSSKGAIQFPYSMPLPKDFIADIVRYCAAQDQQP
ncbi:MAG TPA: DUF1801 domain-containing protein [Candidatus Limiplasma sp.]|nr:DUF1801 domain-containing protein [Candidatus Limiplasma sp.]HRX08467.1 DUF1801 domain-containing protein [Candidatus Limiplasma sp.]